MKTKEDLKNATRAISSVYGNCYVFRIEGTGMAHLYSVRGHFMGTVNIEEHNWRCKPDFVAPIQEEECDTQ